ncbi:alpha/beta hydrolase [Winogradskyella poriferorum]|uniref:alpha/beta hydrolase n=1 Tax=Winogradskyella poriferorum TaxID=307627 RepID=UPI003D65B924
MKIYHVLVLLFVSTFCFSQTENSPFRSEELQISKWIDGTLLVPNEMEKPKLAIIIAGSGPTDRNGNQNFLQNNSLKKLAENLTSNGIATFRYDKRVVKQLKTGKFDLNTRFDDFVNDAKDVIKHFKDKDEFSEIFVIGHSQGSLIGMLASMEDVDGFISLAGAGQNIGDVILEQVEKTAPMFKTDTERVINTLKAGKTTNDYPPELTSMFSQEIQPFMINWMSYYPTDILNKLDIPILIVNGTKDLQVTVEEAEQLKKSNEKARLKLIENMNHILFIIEGDDLENSKSYNDTSRAISSDLIKAITSFIK